MNIAMFAYSRQGCCTARRVMQFFSRDTIKAYTLERFGQSDFDCIRRPTEPFYGELFVWADALVFIGSCGISVREIAPHVKDKRTDPAVVCIDELGRFVIPLLSGHIGGANELAIKLANGLSATPVITTATDINNRFSVDVWATKNGFVIDNMRHAKAVSAAILEGEVPLTSDFAITTPLPNGIVAGDSGELGISISYRKRTPFTRTLLLVPKVLHIGIGCRKGTNASAIEAAVEAVFAQNRLDDKAVKQIASIALKAEETGIWQYSQARAMMPVFYSPAELLSVPGEFTPSAFVQQVTGVDNVCERAALMGAERLIVTKTALNGVTVAVAAEKLEVRFG